MSQGCEQPLIEVTLFWLNVEAVKAVVQQQALIVSELFASHTFLQSNHCKHMRMSWSKVDDNTKCRKILLAMD